MTTKAPHVRAAFINRIREEGTKEEACNFLQEQWNETCQARDQIAAQVLRIAELKLAVVNAAVRATWEAEALNERIAELEAAGNALAEQAAHVRVGAAVPQMDIHSSALVLGPLVDAWYRAGKGTAP
jgi:putative heme degradation protein